MEFAQQLKIQRKKKNLSALALANECGLSRSYITLIENGKRLPSTKVLPKIAQALNLKINVVLNWYLEDKRRIMQESMKLD